MFYGLEGFQGLAYNVIADAGGLGGQGCGHGVVDIVFTHQGEVFQADGALVVVVIDYDGILLEIGSLAEGFLLGERQPFSVYYDLVQMPYCNLVVGVEDEAVLRTQVAGDAELGLHIILQIVVVAVQMVWRDIRDDGYVRAEIVAAVQLEAADFQHVIVVLFGGYLVGVTLAYVSSQTHVQACLLEQVVEQGSGGGLAVGAGYADLLCLVVSGCELYFGDDLGPLLFEFSYDGCSRWYPWTFDDFVCSEDSLFAVTTLFIFYIPLFQGLDIFVLNLSTVREKDFQAFNFR